ncbi:ATP-binding cassette domain-containing protein [Flavobacterium sp. J49]|uniref:ATP-binding cassette domain-containing protein n=1 Tax=Flavobacterium sp. J49 TaxID=2718534 RepID=UPI001593C84F|nr:ATP-binding cassette domain-containing protein [Flavobacterium sp. J49]MBF6641196.1 ATP-binding cassette domain-containing protein [Flavobacterium sp. J49]NIC02443.1 ATP-binding cassette domain-containing protein [Flavobacterium sp. J49]
MKTLLLKSLQLIPKEKKAKFPVFLTYSLVNTLLDFISIVYLIPVVFLLLDKEKISALTLQYFGQELTSDTIVVLLLSLILFYIVKNSIQSKIIKKQSLFIYDISTKISEKLIAVFLHDSYRNYNAVNKNAFFRDVFQLPVVFSNNVLFSFYTLFSELLIVLFIVGIGLYLNFTITLSALFFLLIIGFILIKIQKKKVDELNATISNLYQENVKNLLNIFYGFIDIKATKAEQNFNRKFEDSSRYYNKQLASLTAFKQTNARYFEIIFVTGLSFGILFLLFKNDSFVDLLFLSFFAGACIKIIPSFNKILSAYLDIKANSNVVDTLLKYKDEKETHKVKHDFNNHLALAAASFNFNEKTILKNLDLQIDKGDFIAVSGPSGNGKTTLLQIIAGLLSPTQGQLILDGKEIDSKENLFDFIGYVSQQPFLFQASILENITMLKKKDIDFEPLNAILKSLDLSDWIDSLPDGIHTPLLLESKKLSGGQKQRIALARALYAQPKILLLDEATNQLNKELEASIFSYLQQLTGSKKMTVVAVSHHGLVNNFCNKQLQLKNGNLIPHE